MMMIRQLRVAMGREAGGAVLTNPVIVTVPSQRLLVQVSIGIESEVETQLAGTATLGFFDRSPEGVRMRGHTATVDIPLIYSISQFRGIARFSGFSFSAAPGVSGSLLVATATFEPVMPMHEKEAAELLAACGLAREGREL